MRPLDNLIALMKFYNPFNPKILHVNEIGYLKS